MRLETRAKLLAGSAIVFFLDVWLAGWFLHVNEGTWKEFPIVVTATVIGFTSMTVFVGAVLHDD